MRRRIEMSPGGRAPGSRGAQAPEAWFRYTKHWGMSPATSLPVSQAGKFDPRSTRDHHHFPTSQSAVRTFGKSRFFSAFGSRDPSASTCAIFEISRREIGSSSFSATIFPRNFELFDEVQKLDHQSIPLASFRFFNIFFSSFFPSFNLPRSAIIKSPIIRTVSNLQVKTRCKD